MKTQIRLCTSPSDENIYCLHKESLSPYLPNAGQLSLGSYQPELSRPGSTRPGHFGLVLYILQFSINDASTILDGMCFIKNVQQKFEKIMSGPTLSLVFQS